MQGHLAAGCNICQRHLSRYGDVAALLAALAPVLVPAGVAERLRRQLDAVAPTLPLRPVGAAAGVLAAAAAVPDLTSTAPVSAASRWERFQQWLDDRNLRVPVQGILGSLLLLVIVGLLAFIAFNNARSRPEVTVQDLRPASAESVATPSAGSITVFGHPSTPTAAPISDAPPSEPEATPSGLPQAEPTPRITATPQVRPPTATFVPSPDAPIVILNPGTRVQGPLEPLSRHKRVLLYQPTCPPPPTPPPPRLVASAQSLAFARGENVKTVALNNAGQGQVICM